MWSWSGVLRICRPWARATRVAGVLVAAAALSIAAVPPAQALNVGDRIPAYMLTDLGGRSHDLSSQSGSVVIIHIFGHSSQVCLSVAPRLDANFYRKYGSRGLEVFGVECWNGTNSEVSDFRTTTGVSYPLLQGGSSFASACDLSYNSFILVDAGGTVRYVSAGPAEAAYDEATLTQQAEFYLNRVSTPSLATWGAIKTLYNR